MKEITQLLAIFNKLMAADNYPIASPVAADVMDDLLQSVPPAGWDASKKSAYLDILRLLMNRPDYADMFNVMDGLEYNGLTLYCLMEAENGAPVWSNIFIRNIDTRDNDIYIDPNLTDKVLIGEDGMSFYAFSFSENCFQIRDRVATDYVIESHACFSDLLSALIDTCS